MRDSAMTPMPLDEVNLTASGLFTDLYELTMMQVYFEQGMNEEAVFSLFVREVPKQRNFLLACGLETVLDYLERLYFTDADIAYLKSLERFSPAFLDWLREFRFTGEVHAVKEGTPVFANEPILEVVAPLPQAQLIETMVMNQIQLQTLLATKAQRMVAAADGRAVLDFGARRMHGVDAALKAARAFIIAGITGTSNVLAGRVYGVPVSGTMAHSYIQAHDDELEAFRDFMRVYPDTVLLVDTYDTLEGVQKVIELARELGDDFRVSGVRLDSGDLFELSCETRRMLDAAGLKRVKIIASGGLDEYGISELLRRGAPVDGFGVGTSMGVSDDLPVLDIAYKLCEYAGRGRVKLSSGKPVLPGRKQIFRRFDGDRAVGDVVAREQESHEGQALLEPVMRNGQRLESGRADVMTLREQARQAVAQLPAPVRGVDFADPPYPVRISDALHAHQQAVGERVKQQP